MSLDLSRDYLLVDDPVTVSYAVKTAEGTWAAGASVPYVQRNAITKEDAVTDPALLQRDSSVFHLWAAQLGGIVPKIGDRLTFGPVWVVRSVGLMDRDAGGVQRYRCVTIRSTGS